MVCVKVLLLLATGCVLQCSARKLAQIKIAPAQAAPATILSNQTTQGITGFLESNANYSTFLSFVQSDPVYSVLLAGNWSKGVTDNTVLVPTNAAIEAGFVELSTQYNVPANPGQYLALANQSSIGQDFQATPLNTALAQLLAAILNSHIFANPNNVYANATVLGSTSQAPTVLSATGLSDNFATVVYNNGTGDDPRLKFAQPSGLLTDVIAVPEIYAQQVGVASPGGVRTTLYLYEVKQLFVASQVLKAAADAGSTLSALNTIKGYITN